MHIKVTFTLHCSLLCIRALYLKKTIYVLWLKILKYANHHLSLRSLTIFCWWSVWNIARATKSDRQTPSEQMLLEKWDQKTCLMQGHHKPSICNQKNNKKKQCLQSTVQWGMPTLYNPGRQGLRLLPGRKWVKELDSSDPRACPLWWVSGHSILQV